VRQPRHVIKNSHTPLSADSLRVCSPFAGRRQSASTTLRYSGAVLKKIPVFTVAGCIAPVVGCLWAASIQSRTAGVDMMGIVPLLTFMVRAAGFAVGFLATGTAFIRREAGRGVPSLAANFVSLIALLIWA
jgi:hypothetical protein